MLRITVEDKPESLMLRLEGRLAGACVRELEDCWRRAEGVDAGRSVHLDLREVTFVDAAGKALLAALHEQGASLCSSGCWMKAIVDEIKSTGAG